MSTEDDGEQTTDTQDWYLAYKLNERAQGREPLAWGDWLRAGMPTPINP